MNTQQGADPWLDFDRWDAQQSKWEREEAGEDLPLEDDDPDYYEGRYE